MSQRINGQAMPDGYKTGVGSNAPRDVKESWRVVRGLWEILDHRGVPLRERKAMIARETGLSRRQVKRRLQNWKRAKKAGHI